MGFEENGEAKGKSAMCSCVIVEVRQDGSILFLGGFCRCTEEDAKEEEDWMIFVEVWGSDGMGVNAPGRVGIDGRMRKRKVRILIEYLE
jgi:hypothetical protein